MRPSIKTDPSRYALNTFSRPSDLRLSPASVKLAKRLLGSHIYQSYPDVLHKISHQLYHSHLQLFRMTKLYQKSQQRIQLLQTEIDHLQTLLTKSNPNDPILRCPECSKPVVRIRRGYKCIGWKCNYRYEN